MKKILCLLVSAWMLTGCSSDALLEQALAFRGRLLGAQNVTFEAEIRADYIDHVEEFTLNCRTDSGGGLTFSVTEPEEISGITGGITGEEGQLSFDGTVLAFPMMASDRLCPVSGPWVMMKALRTGYITSCAGEGALLHLTVDDSYADDALTLEIWLEGDQVKACEIAWQGMRQMTMEIEDFLMG